MEYIEGQTLSQVIADGLAMTTARQLATQIASGLAAAHAQEVVHGDLKPENIFVTDHDAAKILDFGLARSHNTPAGDAAGGATQRRAMATDDLMGNASSDATIDYIATPSNATDEPTEAIRGTPAYMSPEQAMGLPATPATDVFAFGLVLFEMLTGRRARPEQPVVRMLLDVETHDLGPELAPSIDPCDRHLLTTMLALAPADRPSMSEVARQVTEWVQPS